MKSLSEKVRISILQKFQQNSSGSIRTIAKELNLSKTTVYSTIKRFGENHTFKDLPGRGRKVGSYNKKKDKDVMSSILKNRSMSVRDIGKKLILQSLRYKISSTVMVLNLIKSNTRLKDRLLNSNVPKPVLENFTIIF